MAAGAVEAGLFSPPNKVLVAAGALAPESPGDAAGGLLNENVGLLSWFPSVAAGDFAAGKLKVGFGASLLPVLAGASGLLNRPDVGCWAAAPENREEVLGADVVGCSVDGLAPNRPVDGADGVACSVDGFAPKKPPLEACPNGDAAAGLSVFCPNSEAPSPAGLAPPKRLLPGTPAGVVEKLNAADLLVAGVAVLLFSFAVSFWPPKSPPDD